MRTWLSRLTTTVAVGLLASGVAVPALAQAAPAPRAAPAACATPTPAALADFFDKKVPGRLTPDLVPGTVVSVVAGEKEVFSKGYGVADTTSDVAFDPARTPVRIGSITKLFTWTAVMQQVQAGRLDLNADVNRYLKTFKIPATYPEPVTLRNLMDHTAGFEDRGIGTGARTAADVPPLGDYLAHHMPARIRPPGEISAYSNYGAALAGYIVSQVTGESYDVYVKRHLLTPLGMKHSTATEPVPALLAADLAHSYDSDTKPPKAIPFTFDSMPPDGSVSATADDMAHFMIAQLNEGRSGENTILSPATTALMHQRSFAADPRLGGYAHGFMDRTVNGHRILTHDGSWEGFQSDLILVPGCRTGLFVSANGTGGTEKLIELTQAFLDRFAPRRGSPDSTPAPHSTSSLAESAPRAGFYAPTRHNESTVEKLVVLTGQARLTVDSDGTVHFKGKDWKPQGDGLYAQAGGADHLVFLAGKDGKRYVATDGTAYQLMATAQSPLFNLVVLLVFVIVALSGLAIPLAALRRRMSRRRPAVTGTWRTARVLGSGSAFVGLGFLVLLTYQFLEGDFLYGATTGLRLLLITPLILLVMTAAAAVCTVRGWRGSGAGLAARIHQVVMGAGLAGLAWFLWEWNLIGWQY